MWEKSKTLWFNPPYSKFWRQALVNTFLDFWTNIFHRTTNFEKILIKKLQSSVTLACQTWRLKLMDIIKKYWKIHRLQKKLCYCLKKENCSMRGGCCRTKNVIYYARISCNEETYKPKLYKGICATIFKNVTQIIKNLLMRKRIRTTLNYLLNTGS